MADPEQVEIVKKGKDAIAEWRKEHPDERIVLRRADLSSRDLREGSASDRWYAGSMWRWSLVAAVAGLVIVILSQLDFDESGGRARRSGERKPQVAAEWEGAPSHSTSGTRAAKSMLLGSVHGCVVAGGREVDRAELDLLRGDELLDGAVSVEGFFVFEDDPPRDVDLRLIIKHDDAYQEQPLPIRYSGEPLDLGTIELVPFSRLKVNAVDPDGKPMPEVLVGLLLPEGWEGTSVPGRWQALDAAILPWRMRFRPGTHRICIHMGDLRVVREVTFGRAETVEIDVVAPTKPVTIRGRLVDPRGHPLRAMLSTTSDPFLWFETAENGDFETRLPHGGVHRLRLNGLFEPGRGWLILHGDLEFPVDTEISRATKQLDLDGRVLVLGIQMDQSIRVRRLGEASPGVRGVEWTGRATFWGGTAAVSGPLLPGRYGVFKGSNVRLRSGTIDSFSERAFKTIKVRDRGWTVLDLSE